MNLKEDIERCLSERKWNPHRLAKEAGLASDMGIRRVLSGEREGLHSKNLGKLLPFLYGDRRQKAQPASASPDTLPLWIVSTPGVGLTCTSCDAVLVGVPLDSPAGRDFVDVHSRCKDPYPGMRKGRPAEAEVGA